MKYDYESTKARSPNTDKFYFCEVCGAANSPFLYKDLEEFKRQCKRNRCLKCMNKEDSLFEKNNKI